MTSEQACIALLDKEFMLACDEGEKPALMQAASTLDKRLRAARNQGASTRSFEQLLVVVALNLCNEVRSSQLSSDSEQGLICSATLDRLIKKVDEALS